jgi:glycopeptide antibiotics resistance protein
MPAIQQKDVISLFGALILGFALFLLINYLSLFGVVTVDSDLITISLGVLIGFVIARFSNSR